MYSFVHNKSRNRLGTKKAEALVYIYANNRLLRQRAVANPIRWYDNNIMLEESDLDGEDDSNSEYDGDDDNAGNDGAGNDIQHEVNDIDGDGNDANGPAEDGGGPRFEVFDWEGFDAEDHVVQVPLRNVSVARSEGSGSSDHSRGDYDDVRDDDDDDEDNDDNHDGHHGDDDRDGEYGDDGADNGGGENAEENNDDNNDNYESDNNGRGHGNNIVVEGPAVGDGNTDDGGIEPTYGDDEEEEVPRSYNVGGPNVVDPPVHDPVPSVGDEASPVIDGIVSTMVDSASSQNANPSTGSRTPCAPSAGEPRRLLSVGSTILNLIGASQRTSSRPRVHRGPSIDHRRKVLRASRTTLALPVVHGSTEMIMRPSLLPTCRNAVPEPKTGSEKRTMKRSSSQILPFLDMGARDGILSGPVVTVPGGPQVGSDAEDPLAKRRKRLVRTNVCGEDTIELRNENSEIEGLVRTNYGDEDDLLGDGDDEREDDDCDEAPCDGDVIVRSLPIPRGEPPRRSGRLRNTT